MVVTLKGVSMFLATLQFFKILARKIIVLGVKNLCFYNVRRRGANVNVVLLLGAKW